MGSSLAAPPVRVSAPFRVPLRSSLTPLEAVLWLRGERRPFALIGDWLGGTTVLGSEPLAVMAEVEDPFSNIGAEDPFRSIGARRSLADGGPQVGGGWVGWFSYQLGARVERLPPPPPAPARRPSFSLAYYDHVLVHDGERWWLEGLGTPERADRLSERLQLWESRLRAAPPEPRRPARIEFSLAGNGPAGHLGAVGECRERIIAGELLQANICLRLEGRTDAEALDLFALAIGNAAPRFGALCDGLVSLSPERFLRRAGRDVWSEPIKGTSTRSSREPGLDAGRDALSSSSKDAAEHVMIVDLMRNDLGRVCAYGTVEVQPRRIEPHGALWHMVTTVSGRLREGVDDGELLHATFPPGSVTGAPKVQAMKVISSLEATRREAYTGAIGILSPIAGVDLSVAIRTFELRDRRIWLGAGGGIVADSDPQLELAEALAKASGPIAAIGGRIARSRPATLRVPPGIPRALAFGSRPEPRHGVFDTLLVEAGRPVNLHAHLARLGASMRELYGLEPPGDLERRVTDAAARASARSRLRIDADPRGAIRIDVQPAPGDHLPPVSLAPFVLPGGLGPHKWSDRSLFQALAARFPGSVPLLLDGDGQVLEAAHANIWLLEAGALITPPFDGRILPGITAVQLLERDRRARAEPFDLERLAGAQEIFLTSSIRGRHGATLR